MNRLLSPCLVVLVLAQGCSCAPPAVGGDAGAGDGGAVGVLDDAGALADASAPADEDAGEEDAGANDADAGTVYSPSGAVLLQLVDGTVLALDLATGATSYPLGQGPVIGAPGSDEGTLYVYSPTETELGAGGRIASFDVDTGEMELFSWNRTPPSELVVRGDEVATVYGDTNNQLRTGTLDEEVTLEQVANEPTASAAVYGPSDELYTSSGIGTGLYLTEEPARPSTAHCGGLGYWPETGLFLCALADGTAVSTLNLDDDTLTPLTGGGGIPGYRSALALADGGWIAVGLDCEVQSSRALPDLEPLCPAGFAEIDGRLFAGLRGGGLVEVSAEGEVVARATASVHASGVSTDGDHVAVFGSYSLEGGLVMSADLSAPRVVVELANGQGVALGDDGEVWTADEHGVQRAGPESGTLEVVHDLDDAEGIARLDRDLYVITGSGVKRFSLDDPAYELEDVSGTVGRRLAACEDALVVHDEATLSLVSVAPDGTTATLLMNVVDLEGLGCLADQVVLARDDGSVDVLRLGDESATLHDVTTLPVAARHAAPWSAP